MARHLLLGFMAASLVGACWSDDSRNNGPYYEPPPGVPTLSIGKPTLGEGVPASVRVSIEKISADGILRGYEDARTVEAACEASTCEVHVEKGAVLVVTPLKPGTIRLAVRAHIGFSDRELATTFDVRVEPAAIGLYYDPMRSAGAADGVVSGAVATWHSEIEAPGHRHGGGDFASSSDVVLRVVDGYATVTRGETTKTSRTEQVIAFGRPGVVTLEASIGRLTRKLQVNVIDPAEVETIDVHAITEALSLGGERDVATGAGFELGPASPTLTFPDEPAYVAIFLTDAAGRRAIGGAAGIRLDLGSVVSVDPFSVDDAAEGMGDGVVRLMPRSLGASTVHVAVGRGVASFRAEVK